MTNGKQELFELKLQYYPDSKPAVSSTKGRIGELLGSGKGTVTGKKINGTARWSIFEIVGNICETNIAGYIQTDDRSRINYETKGFGLVPDKKNKPNDWKMPAVIKFSTKAKKYEWLNDTLAILQGSFNMEAKNHQYKAYLA